MASIKKLLHHSRGSVKVALVLLSTFSLVALGLMGFIVVEMRIPSWISSELLTKKTSASEELSTNPYEDILSSAIAPAKNFTQSIPTIIESFPPLFEEHILNPGDRFSLIETLRNTATSEVVSEQDLSVLASALYQAALQSKLNIVERSAHETTYPYFEPGEDANIQVPNTDLVFMNTLSRSILLKTTTSKDAITFSFYGTKDQPEEIMSLRQEIVSYVAFPSENIPDESLEAGETQLIQKGSDGYTVHTYRVTMKDETIVNEELVATSSYAPIQQIVQIGKEKKAYASPLTTAPTVGVMK